MSTERCKLPPLHWLQAFDAAARHLSFKDAADELFLTPSAVSQKIKSLEDCLEVNLFTRMTRALALTREGEDYQILARDVLGYCQQRQREFMRRHSRKDLRISMIPFIAHDIVLPSLPLFQEQNPDTELRIEASTSLVNFAEDDMDAAIRYGLGNWPGLVATPLCRCKIVLVVSPKLLAKQPIDSPEDLKKFSIITMRGAEQAWPMVAHHLKLESLQKNRSLGVDSYLAAMVAAEQGLGIAIGVRPLINPWLEQGRLISVLDVNQEIPQAYYYVRRVQDRDDPKLQQLYIWLKSLFDARARG